VELYLGPVEHWTLKIADVFAGIEERDVDRLVVDLAEPWLLVDQASLALRPGGIFLSHLPTVLQVKTLVDALRESTFFGAVQCFETLQRFWHVEGRSVRPEHRMVAHTGFLVVARRLAPPPCRD
jgi:tRNA (adenine57-N1/adenine58-N1)-methyltransferase